MKKIIVSILVIIISSGIFVLSFSNLLATEKPLYKDITISEIKSKFENNETFILFLYQKACISCKQVKPIINNYIKKTGNNIYAIDINEVDDKSYLVQELDISGTPTVIFYYKGNEKGRINNLFDDKLFSEKILEYKIFED